MLALVLMIVWNSQQFPGWACTYGPNNAIYPMHCRKMETTLISPDVWIS